jgi:peptidoglycan/xylan/chitin deacetylase (PgdA/CDA1 family)
LLLVAVLAGVLPAVLLSRGGHTRAGSSVSVPGSATDAARTVTGASSVDQPAAAGVTSTGNANAASVARHAPVPILMYHVVNVAPASAPYPDLYVAPSIFRAQVRWLVRHGYHAVTLRQLLRHWDGGAPLPAKPIVLSFDDGYRSQYGIAAPALAAQDWPGVLDLQLSALGKPWGLAPRMVRELIAAGWEIDSHTLTHRDLTTLSPADLTHEVAGSRAKLRRLFGVPADFFCYPAGRYDDAVVAAVERAGYLGATTTRFGLARSSERFVLARVRIDGSDGVHGLAAKLHSLGV